MAKRGVDPKIIQIVILSTVTVVVWIGIDVYKALIKVVEPKVLEEQTRVLSPQIDLEFMKKLESRQTPRDKDLEGVSLEMSSVAKLEEEVIAVPTESTNSGEQQP